MLDFFRKYQRYFFMVIAFVIIISFSFFGTYSTLSVDSQHEAVAFTAIDGTEVKRSELDDVVAFISTDAQDKLLFGGAWGPNFLNDGVVVKDFLSTGLAAILAEQYQSDLEVDLESRLEKEKRYNLYTHPQAKFISVESVWVNFAPGIKTGFDALRASQKATDPTAFKSRINLFLNERQLPSQLLRQVLRYQERQYAWITPDPLLERTDLSLFGYHTLDDWFGPRFVRIVAEFIINSAKVAENKGYEISKAEVLADLMRNSEASFKQNLRNPNLGVATSQEYFNEQLRRLGMDSGKAVKAWKQVMLFRRLFGDVGNANVVDPFSYVKFQEYAQSSVDGTVYSLPSELRFGSFQDMQKLEVYLNAVSKRSEDSKDYLMPPKTYLSVGELSKNYPELVQKRYLLEVASINKNTLQSKVSIKETWNWQVEDKNWASLKEQFPDLGVKKGDTREERIAALDSLDDRTRSRVDAFSRLKIIDSHPEWLLQSLEEAKGQEMTVSIRTKGGATPFVGLKTNEELMRFLDNAKIGSEPSDKLKSFTADNKNFYRIKVLDRSPNLEVMTFAEANEEGVLNELLDKELEAYYVKVRDLNPSKYKKEDQSWKPLADVRDQVAEQNFAKALKAIQTDYAKAMPEKSKEQLTNDLLASLRLFAYARQAKDDLEKDPEASEKYVKASPLDEDANKLAKRENALTDQWKLDAKPYQAVRSGERELLDHDDIFNMAEKSWTNTYTYPNGQIYFVFVKSKGVDEALVQEKVSGIHQGIAQDAMRHYMTKLTKLMKEKNAISLNYLNRREEVMEQPEPVLDPNAF